MEQEKGGSVRISAALGFEYLDMGDRGLRQQRFVQIQFSKAFASAATEDTLTMTETTARSPPSL